MKGFIYFMCFKIFYVVDNEVIVVRFIEFFDYVLFIVFWMDKKVKDFFVVFL